LPGIEVSHHFDWSMSCIRYSGVKPNTEQMAPKEGAGGSERFLDQRPNLLKSVAAAAACKYGSGSFEVGKSDSL